MRTRLGNEKLAPVCFKDFVVKNNSNFYALAFLTPYNTPHISILHFKLFANNRASKVKFFRTYFLRFGNMRMRGIEFCH